MTAAEAGGKTGWHVHLVAGARGCLDTEGATGLLGDGDLRHAVTIVSRQSRRRTRVRTSAQVPDPPSQPRIRRGTILSTSDDSS